MTKRSNSILLTLGVLLLLAVRSSSQEFLQPLGSNINLHYGTLNDKPFYYAPQNTLSRPATGSLPIPFIEDFSYAPQNNYPSANFWLDSSVFVNTGFGIAPISIGVATFDGLNRYGYPYNPTLTNLQLSFRADTLTSRYINLKTVGAQTLQPTDSVALSFYYQAAGRGDYPESSDSLVLDFYNPTQKKWNGQKWYKTGPNTPNYNDTLFKRVFIWIDNPDYLRDSFQFRFRNYATTSGDFDHWNIDYIRLDKNRSAVADTAFDDTAFGEMPTSFLKNYSAMPHEQYQPDEMATNVYVRVRNNHNISHQTQSRFRQEYDKTNSLYHDYASGFINVPPYQTSGYCTATNIAMPKIDKAFLNVNANLDFRIKHVLGRNTGESSDSLKANDTLLQYQRFRNYYAFDDGNAEAAYYVLGAGGSMAVKVKLNAVDEILGARIYFSHVGNNALTQNFTLTVWSGDDNGPNNLLMSDTARVRWVNGPGLKEVPEYTLRVPQQQRMLSPGTYFIGFTQGVQTGINVGFDRNYDHRSSLYFNSGSGWSTSQIYGSVMIRPIFGSFDGIPMAIEEPDLMSNNNFMVYPNPASDRLTLYAPQSVITAVQIYDMLGAIKLQQGPNATTHELNTASLKTGIYLLRVYDRAGQVHQQKIIISR